MRDVDFVRKDQDPSELAKCLASFVTTIAEYNECLKGCRRPCNEVIYEARLDHIPSTNMSDGRRTIMLTLDQKETILRDEPKQTLLVLLAAFGGTLGLLAGVSVLSVVELIIWLILFITEKLHC